MEWVRDFVPPILREKLYDQPSAFTPESLLREARRQKALAENALPAVCIR
jgi:uridine phosphorylase